MEELKQWVAAFHKGGVQMSEDYAGLYRPPSEVRLSSTVVAGGKAKSVATVHTTH
jgi:hypothetical protein